MKYIRQFSRWYDSVKEPWRMLILMAYVGISLAAMNTLYVPLMFVGVVMLCFAVGFGFGRHL